MRTGNNAGAQRSFVQVHHFAANHIADDSLTRVSPNLDSSNSAALVYDVRKQGGDDTAKSEVCRPLDWSLCWGKQIIRLSAVICGTYNGWHAMLELKSNRKSKR